jgi:hypothetical protein
LVPMTFLLLIWLWLFRLCSLSPEESLALEGNTGKYASLRLCSSLSLWLCSSLSFGFSGHSFLLMLQFGGWWFPSLWGFSQSYSFVSGKGSGQNPRLDWNSSMSQHLRGHAQLTPMYLGEISLPHEQSGFESLPTRHMLIS